MEEMNVPVTDINEDIPVSKRKEIPSEKNTHRKWPAFVKKLRDKAGKRVSIDRRKTKKYVILGVAVLLFCSLVFAAFEVLTNNYMTPVKTLEEYANKDEYSIEKASLAYGNGLARTQWKRIYKILHDSDIYMDIMDEVEDNLIKYYENNLDKYGEDYKVKFQKLGRLELEKSELRDYRSKMQDYVEIYEELVDMTEDFDSGDWGDLADEMDMTKADTKELVEEYRNLVEKMGKLRVTKGYELELSRTITGSELEEPEVEELTVIVLNVNGRWVRYDDFVAVFGAMMDYFN